METPLDSESSMADGLDGLLNFKRFFCCLLDCAL